MRVLDLDLHGYTLTEIQNIRDFFEGRGPRPDNVHRVYVRHPPPKDAKTLYRRLSRKMRRDADEAKRTGFLAIDATSVVSRWFTAWCRAEGRADIRIVSRRGGRAAGILVSLAAVQSLGPTLDAIRVAAVARALSDPGGSSPVIGPRGCSAIVPLDRADRVALEVAEIVGGSRAAL